MLAASLMDIEIICNTDDAILFANIEANSARNLPWVAQLPEHDGHAVLVGGGPSLAEHLPSIRKRHELGQVIFALNGAAQFLIGHGIRPDYQVILDARKTNVDLIGNANAYLIASQCDPAVFDALADRFSVHVWHPAIEGIEPYLSDRECALIGGGTTVGLSAMCLAYTLGYRKLHLFGYDSSHRQTIGHAYAQPQNATEPVCKVTTGGKVFTASLTMARQAELFPEVCNNLIDRGCIITVDADGLIMEVLRQMRENPALSEADKYEAMWSHDAYRLWSPGEHAADAFVNLTGITNKQRVIDFGCGTGRGGDRIAQLVGCEVVQIDFAPNARDIGIELPFFVADLAKPLLVQGEIGYCTDVMEHIPTHQVDDVVRNIMGCVNSCFFQICLLPDDMSALIGHSLHLSVFPVEWWREKFRAYDISHESSDGENAIFLIHKRV